MRAYFNGQFVDKDEIKISINDRGFLFADGIYEVVRSYNGRLFCLQKHLDRLSRSAAAIRFSHSHFNYLAEIAQILIKENGLIHGDATVYLQITRGAAPRTHAFAPPETNLTILMTAAPITPKIAEQENGINVILVSDQRWSRCDIKTINLLPNILANQKAIENNASEALFIRDGVVLEGTHSNFCAIINDTLVTAPKSNYVLAGITLETVLQLCQTLSLTYEQRPIFESEIETAQELMVISTTFEITPVVAINGKQFQNGQVGSFVRLLQNEFKKLTMAL